MREQILHKVFLLLCLFAFVFHLFQILYLEQSFFRTEYDVEYWKDRNEHSQFQLPLSQRIIGDDGLFAYVGYQLINGATPAGLNAETPPVGKYLIGLSIIVFKNPAYYAFVLGIGSLLLFYLITRKLLHSADASFFATTVLFLDPLIFSQFWKSWVEISQLFFLLLHIYLLLNITKKEKVSSLMLSLAAGIALGLFAESKPAILLPIAFLLDTIFMLKKRMFKAYIAILIGLFIGMLFTYLQYFSLGNSFIDFLKLKKYIINFYLKSQLPVHHDAVWKTLLLGTFPQITSRIPIAIKEYWLLWPIATIIGVGMSFLSIFRKTEIAWRGLAIFTLSTLVIFTFIPSYPRYLVIIMPFLYLLFTKFMERVISMRLKLLSFNIIIVYGIVNATIFLLPSPDLVLQNFYHNLSHQYFQDIYQENISKSSKVPYSRQEFRILNKRLLQDATVKSIVIDEKEFFFPLLSSTGDVKIRITYKTQDLGPFIEDKIIHLVLEDNQWRIKWDWNITLNQFLPGNYIETKIKLGKRGTIFDNTGKMLARDTTGYLVLVNPAKINLKREQEMIKFMESYNYKGSDNFQNEYLENQLPDTYTPLFTFYTLISDKEKNKILSYPGVMLKQYPVRIYSGINPSSINNIFYNECCTRIYSSYNYHGMEGFEKEFDHMLSGFSGGKIILKDKKGNIIRTVLEKKEKNGKDVIIN